MKSGSIPNPDRDIAKLFRKFGAYIRSEEVRDLCRKKSSDFTRIFKFPWFDILLYVIFRCKECVTSELSSYYAGIGWPEKRVSRQAAFKALKKLNPRVFDPLIHKFTELFYQSSLVKTFRGYLLLAVDGTTLNLPAGTLSLKRFGFSPSFHIKTEADAKKATSRSSALYDVTNGIILDFVMRRYKDSELPIAIDQLSRVIQYIRGKSAIFLADRYYDSVEVFSVLEGYGMKYCIRGKANFFKHYVEKMKSNDEWISVHISNAWRKRRKYDQSRQRFETDPWIMIRVVKYQYTYFTKKGLPVTTDLIYFTNLSEQEFSSVDIVALYAKRWQIEVSYKTLKTDYEWERFFSSDCDTEICAIYGKVIFHNFCGVIRKQLDRMLEEDLVIPENASTNKYEFRVNIKQLNNLIRDEGLCRAIRSGNTGKMENIFILTVLMIHKIKVSVRPDRHEKRWGKVVMSGHPTRFRLDGRSWPNIVNVNGRLHTIKPK
ncbi:MAG: IS4 family transposase [Parasporobacterium sp.]|nr:IS4 family transposase [Parasporobacterium sp.]